MSFHSRFYRDRDFSFLHKPVDFVPNSDLGASIPNDSAPIDPIETPINTDKLKKPRKPKATSTRTAAVSTVSSRSDSPLVKARNTPSQPGPLSPPKNDRQKILAEIQRALAL